MRSRTVAVLAFVLLAAAFVVDALTPQALVVAILLDVPIVLAALTQSRRLTASLVVTALVADAAAAFINAAHDGYRWEPIGVGDRLLSMLSIVMVGFLSTAVQERAERVGRLAAQEARARREATLAAAADRVRASLSPDVVIRAIVHEAPEVLDAQTAAWYPARPDAEILAARAGESEVEVVDERPPAEILTLTHRVADAAAVTVVRASDPVGRFVLDRLHARSAIAVPFADRGTAFGVLIAASHAEAPEDAVLVAARGFATVAVNALGQARLFGELAERNAALVERQDVIRDLVYALSHDLRTPLVALAMTLRQAADGAFGALPKAYETVLRDSLVSIDDLRRLAETLLLVARFESGERRPERELVELDAVATEIGSELRAMASARGVALAIEATARAAVRGSRADLKRAVANLVANAIEHTPGGGRVEVRVRRGSRRNGRQRRRLRHRRAHTRGAFPPVLDLVGGRWRNGTGVVHRAADRRGVRRRCVVRAERAARIGLHGLAAEGAGMSAIRAALVEDHALVRAGLRTALRSAGIDVVAEAADGIAGLDTVAAARPDVAVIDLGLPGKDGIALTRELKAGSHPPRIVILTMHERDDDVLAAIAAGADGYCVKSSDPATVIDAVRTVAAGGAYFDPHIAYVVLRKLTGSSSPASPSPLSARETEIVKLIAEGVGNAEIAERLHLGLGTVKGHVADVLQKLSASDRAHAAVIAYRRGLIA